MAPILLVSMVLTMTWTTLQDHQGPLHEPRRYHMTMFIHIRMSLTQISRPTDPLTKFRRPGECHWTLLGLKRGDHADGDRIFFSSRSPERSLGHSRETTVGKLGTTEETTEVVVEAEADEDEDGGVIKAGEASEINLFEVSTGELTGVSSHPPCLRFLRLPTHLLHSLARIRDHTQPESFPRSNPLKCPSVSNLHRECRCNRRTFLTMYPISILDLQLNSVWIWG